MFLCFVFVCVVSCLLVIVIVFCGAVNIIVLLWFDVCVCVILVCWSVSWFVGLFDAIVCYLLWVCLLSFDVCLDCLFWLMVVYLMCYCSFVGLFGWFIWWLDFVLLVECLLVYVFGCCLLVGVFCVTCRVVWFDLLDLFRLLFYILVYCVVWLLRSVLLMFASCFAFALWFAVSRLILHSFPCYGCVDCGDFLDCVFSGCFIVLVKLICLRLPWFGLFACYFGVSFAN